MFLGYDEACNVDHLVAKFSRCLVIVRAELLPDLLVEEGPAERERVLENPQGDVGAIGVQSLTNCVVVVFTGINPGTIENIIDDLEIVSAGCMEEDRVINRNLGRMFYEPILDLPVPS